MNTTGRRVFSAGILGTSRQKMPFWAEVSASQDINIMSIVAQIKEVRDD